MAFSNTASLDYELAAQLSVLSPRQKKEVFDFAAFIASRRRSAKRVQRNIPVAATASCPLDAIVDLAADCNDTDLSINHDKYLYGIEAQ